ncbi:MAG: translation initiation factor IF-2 [Mycoplasmataceae bacterium]|nr:translation initiation factor IF-2 [Mycoplasmataceae bacterium]
MKKQKLKKNKVETKFEDRKTNDLQIKQQLTTVKTELKDGVFIFTGPMSVNDFSNNIKIKPNELLVNLFKKGKLYNLNSTLSEEEIAEICFEYEYDFQKEEELNETNFMDRLEVDDSKEELEKRPPIITIMGHVDHGKTTLIDKIRNSNIALGESGGITQHTGAYQVLHKKELITFLDTPGHEAFTSMRSRGAKVTDIVILVVAADDGVMPQTIEAIDHAKAAVVPIIVFVNKMDKQGADVEKIKGDLSKNDVLCEEWGGNVQFIYGSALKGEGIDKLFDVILLQAELLELKANKNRSAMGTVIESRIDIGKGTIATLIINNGTLLKRDFIVAGSNYGRIKNITSTTGTEMEKAYPGTPVIVTGLNYTPNSGDRFIGFDDEKFAKELANKKAFVDKKNELNLRQTQTLTLGLDLKVINIIIKSDVQGTAEALKYSLAPLKNDEVMVNIIRASVGNVTKSDVLLAQTSNSIIYAFNLKIDGNVKKFAETERVIIKTEVIIYKIIEDVENILKSRQEPKYEELITGEALIQKLFYFSKVGTIAGCLVISGTIKANTKLRVFRDDKLIHEGKIETLQNGKNNIKKAEKGTEFGTHIRKFNDIHEGDKLQTYDEVLVV